MSRSDLYPVSHNTKSHLLTNMRQLWRKFWGFKFSQRLALVVLSAVLTIFVHSIAATPATVTKHSQVIVISLDGATPPLVDQYLNSGAMNQKEGIGLLQSQGITAKQNVTITPSLTAPAHIAIGTGSNAARNDINSNSFHLVASPFNQNISGFAAPIGGYSASIDGPLDDHKEVV